MIKTAAELRRVRIASPQRYIDAVVDAARTTDVWLRADLAPSQLSLMLGCAPDWVSVERNIVNRIMSEVVR